MISRSERQAVDEVLRELDSREERQLIKGETAKEYWAGQRRHVRHSFRADCVTSFLSMGSKKILAVTGRTRNLSRSGVGILARHVCDIGTPVEVEVNLPSCDRICMAGVVQFIRQAGRGYYELGISLRSVGRQPLFADDPQAALESVPWLRDLSFKSKLAPDRPVGSS